MHGGRISTIIDEAAGVAAYRFARAKLMTRSIENLEFLRYCQRENWSLEFCICSTFETREILGFLSVFSYQSISEFFLLLKFIYAIVEWNVEIC